jgi:hypothetical protein
MTRSVEFNRVSLPYANFLGDGPKLVEHEYQVFHDRNFEVYPHFTAKTGINQLNG